KGPGKTMNRISSLMRSRRTLRSRRAFTLIELLIVILILAILMAAAVPLYPCAGCDSQITTSLGPMSTLANAAQAWKASNSAHTYTTTLSDLNPNLGSTPVCPSGGTYSVTISTGAATAQNGSTVPNGGVVIQCSFGTGTAAHGRFAPGIDSN